MGAKALQLKVVDDASFDSNSLEGSGLENRKELGKSLPEYQVLQGKLYQGPRYSRPKANYDPNADGWPGNTPAILAVDGKPALGTAVGGDAKDKVREVQGVLGLFISSSKAAGRLWNAHMVSQSMGGQGSADNIEPWGEQFEAKAWNTVYDPHVRNALLPATADPMFVDVKTVDKWSKAKDICSIFQRFAAQYIGDLDVSELSDMLEYIKANYVPILEKIPDSASIITPAGERPVDGDTLRWEDPMNIEKGRELYQLLRLKLAENANSGSAQLDEKAILGGINAVESKHTGVRSRFDSGRSGLNSAAVSRETANARQRYSVNELDTAASALKISVLTLILVVAVLILVGYNWDAISKLLFTPDSNTDGSAESSS